MIDNTQKPEEKEDDFRPSLYGKSIDEVIETRIAQVKEELGKEEVTISDVIKSNWFLLNTGNY
jgi:hypothetical protein